MRLLLLLLLAGAACGRRVLTGGSTATLDAILGPLEFRFDTSSIPDVSEVGVGAEFGDEAVCDGFKIGTLDVSATRPNQSAVDLGFELGLIEFECRIDLRTTFLFSSRNGQAFIRSTVATATGFKLGSTVFLGPDSLPISATEAADASTCADKVNLGLQAQAQNVVTVVFLNVDSIVTGLIQSQLPALVEPLEEALCATITNLTTSLNEFIVDGALTTALRDAASAAEGGNLLAAEEALRPLPEGVSLLDLGQVEALLDFNVSGLAGNLTLEDILGFFNVSLPGGFNASAPLDLQALLESLLGFELPDFLFPGSGNNSTGGGGGGGGNATVLETLADLFGNENNTAFVNIAQGLLNASGLGGLLDLATFFNSTGPGFLDFDEQLLLDTLDALLGPTVNVSSFVTPALLETIVQGALQGDLGDLTTLLTDLLRFQLPLAGIGSVALNVTEISFNLTDGSASNEPQELRVLGGQTLGLPTIPLGSAGARLGIWIRLDVDNVTVALLPGSPNVTFDFVLEDAFVIGFNWTDIVANTAVLLATDLGRLETFELGTVLDALFDCALATLYAPVRVAGLALLSEGAQLRADGAQDAITCLFTDFLNGVSLLYEGGVPLAVAGLFNGAANDVALVAAGDPAADCPPYPRTAASEATAFNFSAGGGPLNLSAAEGLLAFLPAELEVVSEPTELLVVDGSSVVLDSLVVRRTGEDWLALGDAQLFAVRPEDAQRVLTRLRTGAISVSASVRLESESGGSRRALATTDALDVELSLPALVLAIEVLATLSEYDVYSTPLGKLLDLNCYAGKLSPYGGLTQLDAQLPGAQLALACDTCTTQLLQDVAAALADGGSAQLLTLVEAALNATTAAAVASFAPGPVWDATVAEAEQACREGPAAAFAGDGVDNDVSGAQAFLGVFVAGMAGIAGLACAPSVLAARRRRQAGGVGAEKAAAVMMPETEAMLWHPALPRVVRFGVPALLALNLGLFIVGHVDFVIRIDIIGTLLSGAVAIALEDFSGFSVISSTERLWQDGATGLAVLIGLFSIAWPYVKLVGVAVAWCLPVRPEGRFTFQRRGDALMLMDRLGKWSLLELFFVAFLLVALKVEVLSPAALAPDLYEVSATVLPQLNLYTFTTALLLALVVSNVSVVYHDRLAERLSAPPPRPSEESHAVLEQPRQRWAVAGAALVIGSVLLGAGAVAVLKLRSFGAVPAAAELGGESPELELSLYDFIAAGLEDVDAGRAYFGLVLVASVLVVPLLHLALLVRVAFAKEPPLHALHVLRRVAHVLASWCGTEVFLLGIVLSALEIETVSRTLLVEECEFVLPLINLLAVAGLLDEADARAGCYVITGELRAGVYLFLVSVLAHYLLSFWVMDKLDKAIARVQGPPTAAAVAGTSSPETGKRDPDAVVVAEPF